MTCRFHRRDLVSAGVLVIGHPENVYFQYTRDCTQDQNFAKQHSLILRKIHCSTGECLKAIRPFHQGCALLRFYLFILALVNDSSVLKNQ